MLLAEPTPKNSRIAMCLQCGLFAAAPPVSEVELDGFYEGKFGQRVMGGDDLPSEHKIDKEEKLAKVWGSNIIKRFMDPAGKAVLDLRCLSGALAEGLRGAGADVVGVDPFTDLVHYARDVRKLPEIYQVSFAELPVFVSGRGEGEFDAVVMLSHHVLSHTLSPRRLLESVYRVLKPQGYLFLHEKNVLQPVAYKSSGVFSTGLAHQFHLTLPTLSQYFEVTGFDIQECVLDEGRKGDFRLMRAVATKPAITKQPTPVRADTSKVLSELRWLERTWRLRKVGADLQHRAIRIYSGLRA
jgi:2-polyprenyl-3-methyl-5-hydroxy-6-metoxy-1,4-benzoquinol methylase